MPGLFGPAILVASLKQDLYVALRNSALIFNLLASAKSTPSFRGKNFYCKALYKLDWLSQGDLMLASV